MRFSILLAVTLAACASPVSAPGSADGVAYTMVPHSSGAEIPEVSLPDRPAVARAVNADIASRVDGSDCTADGGTEAYFEPTVDVALAQDDVFSVAISVSYFCGGAYPTNDANVSGTFDLRTGDAVEIDGLFADYTAALPRLRALYLAGTPMSEVEGCEDVLNEETLGSYGFAYFLDPEGIVLQPEFPHVIEACADRRTIPYASVAGLMNADGVAARVVR